MPRIEQIETGPVTPRPFPGQTIDLGSAVAPYQGMAAVGGAIGDVGGVLGQFAVKQAEIKNAADRAYLDVAFKRAETELQEEIAREPDTTKWTQKAELKAAALGTQLFTDAKYAPNVQRELQSRWATWQAETKLIVGNQAARQEIENQKAVLTDAMNQAADSGNVEAAQGYVSQMSELGLIFPEQENGMMAKVRTRAEIQAANRAISTDPIAATEELTAQTETGRWKNFKGLDENTRMALIRESKQAQSVLRAETVRTFQDAINQGEIVSTDDLQLAVDQKRITPQQMRYLNRQQTGEATYAESVVRSAQLSRRITQWSPADQDAFVDLNTIASDMAGLPASMRGPLETMLRNKSSGDISASTTQDAERYIDRLYSANILGNAQTITAAEAKKLKKTEGDPRDASAFERANARVLDLKAQLEQFVRKNPEASAAEQLEFINRQMKGDRAKQGATPLLNGISGSIAR